MEVEKTETAPAVVIWFTVLPLRFETYMNTVWPWAEGAKTPKQTAASKRVKAEADPREGRGAIMSGGVGD